MSALYNEIDPFAAKWLGNLVAVGHVAQGTVDSRSIKELKPEDLAGATQAHFFAGIGVWSYALKLAGWDDSRPVWTGSCPCQPFSGAGKQAGFEDPRHLWPAWFELIRICRPPVILGEQVAVAKEWLDLVQTDLESIGYAFGAAVLTAAGVGAPHIRARLYFVAYASGERRDGIDPLLLGRGSQQDSSQASGRSEARILADAMHAGRAERRPVAGNGSLAGSGGLGELGNAGEQGPQGRRERRDGADQLTARAPGLASFWSDAEWIPCRDGKLRPVESGSFPLAHGIAGRVGRLRAYGNALNAQTAASFIRAVM